MRPPSRAVTRASSPNASTAPISPGSARAPGSRCKARPLGGIRDRRLHARQGRPRASGRAAARILGGQGAAATRVTSARDWTMPPSRSCSRRSRELKRKRSPFAEKPPLHRPTTWLEPRLVAEVNFSEWTPAGLLRAPVFVRLRDDVPAAVDRAGRERDAPPGGGAAPPAPCARRHRRCVARPRCARAAGEPGQELRADSGERAASAHQPRPRLLARDRRTRPAITKRDFMRYLAARRALHAAAPEGPAAHHDPHARGHRRRALLSEALGAGAAGVRRDGDRCSPSSRTSGTAISWPTTCRRSCGSARSARSSSTSGTRAPASVPPEARRRAAPTTPARSRRSSRRCSTTPTTWCSTSTLHLLGQGGQGRGARAQRQGLRGRQARGVLAARAARGDVARGGRQDLRQDRPARVRAHRAHGDLR